MIESIDGSGITRRQNCALFQTVDVHYFEIFKDVKISSFVDRPVQINYEPAKKEDIAKMVNQKTEVGKNPIKSKLSREMRGETDHRSLFDIPVDAPLKACASKSWGSGYIAVSGSGANGIGRPVVNNWGAVTTNYTFEIGATEGCVSLEADFSGWYLKIETFLFILFMLCLCN